ncbi:hypothetical protein GYH37_23305 [Rhizobium laguerreae]|nr:hypothetical protein [Rhizobium laguerreae]
MAALVLRRVWTTRQTPFRPDHPISTTFLTVDALHDIIEVPDIAFRRRLAAYAARIIKAMLSPPSADGLAGNDDPEIEQHFLNIAQAQIKAKVEPDSTGYDFDRIAVVLAGRCTHGHGCAATSISLPLNQCDSVER